MTIDYDKLADAINKGRGSAGSSVDLGPAGASISKFTEPIKKATQYVEDAAGAFNQISQTGNSFNNDIIGMKVAAANSRMSFDEFTQMMSKNGGEIGKNFAGIGGSVAKGGMAFTEFSKTFFDSGVAENLRQMGYTSKDLNEVLASQIGFQKSTTDTSVAGQIRTAQAAAELATEMDLIAKMTGKSRKEQEAQLEKAKADGQVEAKMRLIGLQQGADAEKIARENYAKQLAQAQAMGTDQAFKEMFATGTVRSQEAAMQMGLLGSAARETANSAKALARGNAQESQAAMERAKIGNMQNQRNEALLTVAASGTGAAADVMKKNIETNDAAYHGAVKTAKAMGLEMSNVTEVLKAQKKAIQDEQQARHGATSAMVAVTARLQDARAAVANKVVKPLNEGQLDQAGRRIAGELSQGTSATDTAAQTAGQYRQAIIAQGQLGGPNAAPAGARQKIEAVATQLGVDKAVQTVDKVAGGAIEGAQTVALKATNFVGDAMKVYQMNKTPTRDEGTLGKTGQAVEPEDIEAIIRKGETVTTPDQMKNLLAGAKTEGISNIVQDFTKAMPKIDMAQISKGIDIKTSPVGKIDQTKFDKVFSSIQQMDPSKMVAEMQAQWKNATPTSISKTAPTKEATTPSPKLPTSVKDIATPVDKSKIQMPSLGQLTIGPDGMPRVMPKSQPQSVAQAQPTAKTTNQQNEDAKKGTMASQPKPQEQPPEQPTTTKTQDDVTKLLSSLNTTMDKVYSAIMDSNAKLAQQVKATKSMSGNVHDRA